MSSFEQFLFLGSIGLNVWLYGPLLNLPGHQSRKPHLLDLLPMVLLLAYAAGLWLLLTYGADIYVRNSILWRIFYVLLGGVWISLSVKLFAGLGLDLHAAVVDRRHLPEACAAAAAVLASGLGFAGANLGDGPGWWGVVYTAALATAALVLCWCLLATFTPIRQRALLDRDPAAAARLSGELIALGLVFGRAAAGDWTSVTATNFEFAEIAWPALPALVLMVLGEWFLHAAAGEEPEGPAGTGLPVALLWVGAAGFWLLQVGPW